MAGFAFSTICRYEAEKQAAFNYPDFDPSYPSYAQPALDYLGAFVVVRDVAAGCPAHPSRPFGHPDDCTAPEYIVEKRCDVGSDMWSFGCLMYALYNGGRSPIQAHDTLAGYNDAVKAVDATSYTALPPALGSTCPPSVFAHAVPVLNVGTGIGGAGHTALVQAMLKKMPEARPMARQLSGAPYFDNLILKALIYMDALSQKPPAEKAQFFRSLPKALPQFPERIVLQKVLPRTHGPSGRHLG